MKTNIVNQDWNKTFVIDRSSESWLFENGHTFSSAAGAAINSYYQSDVEIVLAGHAATTSADGFGAIDSLGERVKIVLTATGSIDAGHTGIATHGGFTEVENSGRIEGDVHGVYATGDSFYLANMGYIGGKIGVHISGANSVLANIDQGEINGSVVLNGLAGETLWFNNYGKVSAQTAIVGGDSNEIVFNSGNIEGSVSLGRGNDVFDTRQGQLSVTQVEGGEGDDVLYTSRSDYQLNEAEHQGFDTVRANVTYSLSNNVEQLKLLGHADINGNGNNTANEIIGNRVDNSIFGLGGDDLLDGRRGNDILNGGDGKDTFVFGSRYDMDMIVDFVQSQDTIDVSGWQAISDYASLLKHAEDHGDDLWIIAGKDMLIIKDLHKADLHEVDFTF